MLRRFSEFELDEERYELRREGTVLEVQPKVMEVLLHLVRNADRVCSKDELIDAVWGDVTVSEASLFRCIGVARRLLGETEADARVIQTVRGVGYRIGVPVATDAPGEPTPAPSPPDAPAPAARPRRRRAWLAAGGAVALAAGLAWLARPYASLPGARPTGEAAHPVFAVAVLPTPPARADAAGVAEDVALQVVERLSAIAELRVVASARSFEAGRGDSLDPRELGERLSAGTLVFGRAQLRDGRSHVAFEVVDAGSGFQRWARSYAGGADGSAPSGGAIADDLARVVGTLVEMGPGFVRTTGPVSPLRHYLRGREAAYASSRRHILEAIERYEQAIQLDPSLVSAYVGLADAYERLWDIDGPGAAWLDRGEIAILKARELDPDHAYAAATHGVLLKARKRWEESEAAFLEALELGPSARIYSRYASLLCMLGRTPEAVELVERAVELSPLDPDTQRTAGRVYHYLDDHERAVAHLLRALELDPHGVFTPRLLAGALESNGQPDMAAEAMLLVAPGYIRPPARIYGRLFGHDAGLRLLLELDIASKGEACRGDGHGTAMAWARLGERERMIDCLAEDVARERHLFYILEDPVFDPYRRDPRFQAVLRDAGYPVSAL